MQINEYFKNTIADSRENFVNFVKVKTEDLPHHDILDREIDWLIQRIAQNMFYYKDNIETAKGDYITLVGMLIKKGVAFKEIPIATITNSGNNAPEPIDINSNPGDKIKGMFDENGRIMNGYDSQQEFAMKYITPNNTYTIDFIVINQSHSHVYLKEFPSIGFNTVHFTNA